MLARLVADIESIKARLADAPERDKSRLRRELVEMQDELRAAVRAQQPEPSNPIAPVVDEPPVRAEAKRGGYQSEPATFGRRYDGKPMTMGEYLDGYDESETSPDWFE